MTTKLSQPKTPLNHNPTQEPAELLPVGYDHAMKSSLFNTLPMKWHNRRTQKPTPKVSNSFSVAYQIHLKTLILPLSKRSKLKCLDSTSTK